MNEVIIFYNNSKATPIYNNVSNIKFADTHVVLEFEDDDVWIPMTSIDRIEIRKRED